MSEAFDYEQAGFEIPLYKADAHRGAWSYLAAAGSWWTGPERIAIAEASRAAVDCQFCAERKAALSPLAVDGEHSGGDELPAQVVDVVHRVTTDSARLTESWVQSLISADFGYGHYVELVSIVVNLASIDTLHRALDLPLEPLPEPKAGTPDGYQPAGASIDVAWVPMVYPENLTEQDQDIYFGAEQTGHVIRAMSLVPDAVRWLNRLSEAHYLPTPEVMDMNATGHLSLSRTQTELVAARTSIHNDCFY